MLFSHCCNQDGEQRIMWQVLGIMHNKAHSVPSSPLVPELLHALHLSRLKFSCRKRHQSHLPASCLVYSHAGATQHSQVTPYPKS